MIVYTFKVHSLTKKTVNSVSDTVTAVVWERTGVDVDGYTGSHKVCTNLDTNQVGISTSYTIYDDLTKSDILSWIQSIEDMDDVNGIIAPTNKEANTGALKMLIPSIPVNVT